MAAAEQSEMLGGATAFGPHRNRRRLRWTIAAGTIGVVVSVVVAIMLRHREDQLAETKFTLNAQKRAEVIQRALSDQLSVVRALSAFFAGSQSVERDEFRVFATTLLTDYPGTDALLYVQRVSGNERVRHETALRSEVEDYEIRDRGAGGKLVRAANRGEYWPTYYFESQGAPADMFGFDLWTEPLVRAVLDRGLKSERLVAGAAAPLRRGTGDKRVIVAAAPVYNEPGGESGPAHRGPKVVGFAMGVFKVGKIVAEAIDYVDSIAPAGVDTYVFADVGSQGEDLLYVKPSKLRRGPFEPLARLPDDRVSPLHVQHTFEAGMNRWTVYCEPIPGYMAEHRTWTPWVILLVGLALTALFEGYLMLLLRQTADIERLAQRRAGELRAISNAALDAVIMMDPQGRIGYWNPAAERIFGFRRDEVIGRQVHETIVPPQYRQQATAGISAFLAQGTGPVVGRVVEVAGLRKDGSEFPVEVSIAPLAVGDSWGAVAVIRDITVRKRSEEALDRERRLLRHVLNLQERDRKLVAYEIHDGLAQQLAGAMMKLQAYRALDPRDTLWAESLLDQSYKALGDGLAEARRLIGGLRPPILDEAGIVAAIEFLVNEENRRGCAAVAFEHDVHFNRLAGPLETAVFRVVQEALTNASRYSHSDQIKVSLSQPNGNVRVEIRDWGVGFDPNAVGAGRFGLQGMRERARLMGGVTEITAAPGKGVHVRAEFPLVESGESGEAENGAAQVVEPSDVESGNAAAE